MVARFSAVQIACLEEDGVLTVVFGGAPEGDCDPPYLLLSRTLAPDAHDVKLGQDCSYLELSDQSKSVYGGISSVHLSPREIRVVLDARGKRALALKDAEICVSFAPSAEKDRLEQALRRVLNGVSFSVDAA